MTQMFLDREFSGYCYDLSPESRAILKNKLKEFGNRIEVLSDLAISPNTQFDYLLAFEVLEHIEDDFQALQHWSQFLKSDGRIIISVPAHKNKFSKIDELVGHVRRYEKSELFNLLSITGYKNIKIVNYGYPISELSRYVSTKILKNENSTQSTSIEERNLKSSYSRPAVISRHIARIPENTFTIFKYIQRFFYRYDLGDGLVAIAEKK